MVLLWGTISLLNAYYQLLRPCITSAKPPHKKPKVTTNKQRYLAWYFYEEQSDYWMDTGQCQLLRPCMANVQLACKDLKVTTSKHTFNLKTIHYLTIKMFNCETQKCLNVPTNIISIFHFNNIYIWQWVTETLTVRCVLCVIHYTLTLERGVVQWCKEKRQSVVKTLDKEDWGSNPFWSAQIFGRHSNLSVGRNILASKDILVSRNILVGRDIVNFSAVRSCTEKCWSRQRHQVMFWAG